ncbi:hypothetical protein EVAR_34441_1 [Eumeta japonica]|uniref:Uncharacterized protein n=1 Tax=Eumeta variegata TaxID=151549 RepID=A0A4C1WN65_EUMVA|nr:hypothetical protein EVAR_34441_1 [Eumeta japonica]
MMRRSGSYDNVETNNGFEGLLVISKKRSDTSFINLEMNWSHCVSSSVALCNLGRIFLYNMNANKVQYHLRKACVGRLSTVAGCRLRMRVQQWRDRGALRYLSSDRKTSPCERSDNIEMEPLCKSLHSSTVPIRIIPARAFAIKISEGDDGIP